MYDEVYLTVAKRASRLDTLNVIRYNFQVAAWSRPVSRAGMERAARALGVSSSDVALYAATEALRAFFEGTESETPDSVLITARAASEDFLYTFVEGNGKNYKKSQTGGNYMVKICH